MKETLYYEVEERDVQTTYNVKEDFIMRNDLAMSLGDLLGEEYVNAVAAAAVSLLGVEKEKAESAKTEKVEFFPESYVEKLDSMLDRIGQIVTVPFTGKMEGAPTQAFAKAANHDASPISGFGYYRVGQDGKLYVIAKSEHYHTPLGHFFPGYKLIDNARTLGISNATHNNTRGYITRLCEQELVRIANGLGKDQKQELEDILKCDKPHVLNRVINLETGSLACEAGIKMMLARFYKLDKTFPAPKYSGRIPVFFVMGDYEGGRMANYHGTTVIAQTFRDMWPEFYKKNEENDIYKVVPVAINDLEDFRKKYEMYNQGKYKAAGFTHEIILMNYGGIRLEEDYLRAVYKICHEGDTPIMCDEIQSCMWYDGMFLFRQYGLNPDFSVVGKGFPGGQYPASRIITTAEMDNLNQFGALVTNGQEELASLSYLITMAFVEQNGSAVSETGRYYEARVKTLKDKFPEVIDYVEGEQMLSAITFKNVDDTVTFVKKMTGRYFDISAQVYKAFCPPAALLKLPLIATHKLIDCLIWHMEAALHEMEEGK